MHIYVTTCFVLSIYKNDMHTVIYSFPMTHQKIIDRQRQAISVEDYDLEIGEKKV